MTRITQKRIRRTYRALRGVMLEQGLTIPDLARMLGVSTGTVSLRMNHRQPWSLEMVYMIMDHLGLEIRDISYFFPADPYELPTRSAARREASE